MRLRWSRVLGLLVPAFVVASLAALGGASGDDRASAVPSGADAAAPPRPRAAAPAPPRAYVDLCSQGHAKYAAHDFAAAVERYQKAIAKVPTQPLAYYLLGEAQLAAGSFVEAESAWNQAVSQAGDADPAMHARALFVLADLHERRIEWDAARTAWQTYLDWLARFPDVTGAPASARARIAAIDAARKQDEAYEPVRRRIAQTSDGGVFTDPAKPAPSP